MILGSDRTRLSKRHGATSVMAYRDMGVLPHALVNYLARLGWSHGDQEIFSIQELIEKFSLDNVGKSSGVFNPEKLIWLNQHYIKEARPEDLARLLIPILEEMGLKAEAGPRLYRIVETLQERSRTLREMAEFGAFYFRETVAYDRKAADKFLTPENAELFKLVADRLSGMEGFTEEGIEKVFAEILEETGLKLGKLAQPVRVALTGGTVSPGIFETMEALGREKTIARLRAAEAHIKGSVQE
jgi:glutamyl-tRNA synthetase